VKEAARGSRSPRAMPPDSLCHPAVTSLSEAPSVSARGFSTIVDFSTTVEYSTTVESGGSS